MQIFDQTMTASSKLHPYIPVGTYYFYDNCCAVKTLSESGFTRLED
jgi:hypothetical protein